jgi:hypothetical protein
MAGREGGEVQARLKETGSWRQKFREADEEISINWTYGQRLIIFPVIKLKNS